jgi:hypothetical protein
MAAASSSAGPVAAKASGLWAPANLVSTPTAEYKTFVEEAKTMDISELWAQRYWLQKKGRLADARKALGKFKALADEYGLWTLTLDEDILAELGENTHTAHRSVDFGANLGFVAAVESVSKVSAAVAGILAR